MIQLRHVGPLLLALAVVLYVAVTAPGFDAAAEARAQHASVRHDTEEAARRLADAERRAAFLRRAVDLMSGPGAAGADSIQRVRAGIVRTLRESRVSHVRLEVRPAGNAPAVAGVSLAADAAFVDLLRLISRLDHPGSGLVLQRVSFGAEPSNAAVDAVAIGAAP